MAKPPKADMSNELHSDAWSRFERAVDVVAKSPPQHRTKKDNVKRKPKKPKKSNSKSI
jgi:hypothetical protein